MWRRACPLHSSGLWPFPPKPTNHATECESPQEKLPGSGKSLPVALVCTEIQPHGSASRLFSSTVSFRGVSYINLLTFLTKRQIFAQNEHQTTQVGSGLFSALHKITKEKIPYNF
jgi:hypothetical protein